MRTPIYLTLLLLCFCSISWGSEPGSVPFSEDMLYDTSVPRSDVYFTVYNEENEPMPEILVAFEGFEAVGPLTTNEEGGVHLGDVMGSFPSPFASLHGWIGAYPRGMQFAVMIMDPMNPDSLEYRVVSIPDCTDCDPMHRNVFSFSHRLGTGQPFTPGDDLVDDGQFMVTSTDWGLDFYAPLPYSCLEWKLEFVSAEEEDCHVGTALACVTYANGFSPVSFDFTGSESYSEEHTVYFSSSISGEAKLSLANAGLSFSASSSSGSSTTVAATTTAKVDADLPHSLHADALKQNGQACIRFKIKTITMRWYWRRCGKQNWIGLPSTEEYPVVIGTCLDTSQMTP